MLQVPYHHWSIWMACRALLSKLTCLIHGWRCSAFMSHWSKSLMRVSCSEVFITPRCRYVVNWIKRVRMSIVWNAWLVVIKYSNPLCQSIKVSKSRINIIVSRTHWISTHLRIGRGWSHHKKRLRSSGWMTVQYIDRHVANKRSGITSVTAHLSMTYMTQHSQMIHPSMPSSWTPKATHHWCHDSSLRRQIK